MKNLCVCCGAVIPEGMQVCKACSADVENNRTNRDVLREMSNSDLAKWLVFVAINGISSDKASYESLVTWLESPCDRPRCENEVR